MKIITSTIFYLLICIQASGQTVVGGESRIVRNDSTNLWESYISCFPEIMEIDSMGNQDVNLLPTKRTIPSSLLKAFFLTDATYPDIDDYQYFYGNKFRVNDRLAAFVFRKSDTFLTKFGRGVEDCILTIYDKEGNICDQRVIGRRSADNISSISIRDRRRQNQGGEGFLKYADIFVYDTVVNDCRGDSIYATYCYHKYSIHRQQLTEVGSPAYFRDAQVKCSHRAFFKSFDWSFAHPEKSWYYEKKLTLPRKDYGYICMDNRSSVKSQLFPIDTARIERAYQKLKENPDGEREQWEFFNAYPSNWNDLRDTYLYKIYKNFDLSMFLKSQKHLLMFEGLCVAPVIIYVGTRRAPYPAIMHIPDSVYMKKLILTVCDGVAQQGTEYLHEELSDFIYTFLNTSKGDELFRQLSLMSPAYQFGFFRFLFATSHTEFEKDLGSWYDNNDFSWAQSIKKYRKRFGEKYPDVMRAMEDAYDYYHCKVTEYPRPYYMPDDEGPE